MSSILIIRSNEKPPEGLKIQALQAVCLIQKDSGWTKEANIVAWNGGVPKLDIREWDPEHERMSKGITLMEAEAEALAKVLAARYSISR